MARLLNIHNLASQPDAVRNEEWERTFLAALSENSIEVGSREAQPGPDGWPYLFVTTSPSATEPASRVLHWLSERGIGMVINAEKTYPDFVLTYGMIWNYRERGEFISDIKKSLPQGDIEIGAGKEVLVGSPTESYLPKYVRKILKEFFVEQSVLQPKILMMSTEEGHFDLCFSRESLGNPPESEAQGIAEAIAWFLPNHYSIMLVSENNFQGFELL